MRTKKRDKKAAKRFFVIDIRNNRLSEKITIDKSGSNKAAIEEYNAENNTSIKIRQVKFLNNIVEQLRQEVASKYCWTKIQPTRRPLQYQTDSQANTWI